MSRPPRHRAAPLDAIDSVTHRPDGEVTGMKHIRGDDPYLQGHYPDFTIYPGVFILESAHQLLEEYARTIPGSAGAELTGIRSMRFLAPLLPGDTLHIRCALTHGPGRRMDAKVTCRNARDDKVAQMALRLRMVRMDADREEDHHV